MSTVCKMCKIEKHGIYTKKRRNILIRDRFQDRFYWMNETWKGGASWFCLFGISPQTPTEETSPDIADTTFKHND